MQKLITKIVEAYVKTEQGRQDLVKYFELKTHPGWKIHQAFLIHLGSHLANESMSREFQKLDANERLQRLGAYSMVNEIIKFLLDPARQLERATGIIKHNLAMGATRKGGATKKETK